MGTVAAQSAIEVPRWPVRRTVRCGPACSWACAAFETEWIGAKVGGSLIEAFVGVTLARDESGGAALNVRDGAEAVVLQLEEVVGIGGEGGQATFRSPNH